MTKGMKQQSDIENKSQSFFRKAKKTNQHNKCCSSKEKTEKLLLIWQEIISDLYKVVRKFRPINE